MNAIGTSAVLESMMVDEKMMNKSRDIVSALLTQRKISLRRVQQRSRSLGLYVAKWISSNR